MQRLIELIKKGERKAQEELYKKYADKMFLTCFRYVNNDTDAGEILNTGFYKAFMALKKFEFINEAAFESWLRKIMANESLMFLRKKSKKRSFINFDQEINKNLTFSENYMSDKDYYTILSMLPDGYRIIFNLYAIEGYSHSEIAEMLKISESTSRSQLSRARELLQKFISKEL